ncbi:1272_t:CDS:1 [Ambispora leptoticha]|uniref:1272_t:CDS:1 n=1 Tax=Ambispora leptoticha TaxID=144679 RepID=A0A9N9EZY7_9GLOM|nr:1272_t:CDS:1 [Ambispora leptoticha]
MSEVHFVSNNKDDTDEQVFTRYYEFPSSHGIKGLKKCSPFLLFRREVSKALKKGGRVKRSGEISTFASKLWKKLGPDEIDQYHRLSAALSRQHASWSISSSTQYLQTSIPNAAAIHRSSRQHIDVQNVSSMELPHQIIGSSMEPTSIPNFILPESEKFMFSKEIWADTNSDLFGLPLVNKPNSQTFSIDDKLY